MKTNWSKYYHSRSNISLAYFTRLSTERILAKHMKNIINPSICELGGANSCFFKGLRKKLNDERYTIVDNNEVGLNLFVGKMLNRTKIYNHDLSKSLDDYNIEKSDIVFSVGLIEHFDEIDTIKVINNHFKYLKDDGLCIITFPTPTLLYRAVRGLLSFLNLWSFPDERPLSIDSVVTELSKKGIVIDSCINNGCILTQGIVVCKYGAS